MPQKTHSPALWPLLAACLISASPVLADSLPAPLEPATAGKLQCYGPNSATRTCQSLAAYKRAADGTIENIALVLISASPAIAMETVSPVEVKAGQVCGRTELRDIDTATFFVGPRMLDAQQSKPLRKRLKLSLQTMFGREICTAYVHDHESMIARSTMDGEPMATPEQRVIWVSPDDGYKVSP